MFQMDPLAAAVAFAVMAGLYFTTGRRGYARVLFVLALHDIPID